METIQRARGGAAARARSTAWQDGAGDRDPRQPRGAAALDRVVRGARAERGRTSTTTTSSRCSTTSSGSRPAAAARAPGPTATGCWASTSSGPTSSSARSPPAARASSRAGCGSTSTTSSTTRSSTTSSRRCGWSPATAGGCSATTASTRATGLWHHRRGPVEPPLRLRRRDLRRRRDDDLPGDHDDGAGGRAAGLPAPRQEVLDDARRRRPSTRPACRPTSTSCGGSSSRPARWTSSARVDALGGSGPEVPGSVQRVDVVAVAVRLAPAHPHVEERGVGDDAETEGQPRGSRGSR